MEHRSIFVGLDVHKDTIAVAVARSAGKGQVLAVLPHSAKAVARKLAALAPAAEVLVCYEAGPTGFGLQRELAERGFCHLVVAPSLVPVRTDLPSARAGSKHTAQRIPRGSPDPPVSAEHQPFKIIVRRYWAKSGLDFLRDSPFCSMGWALGTRRSMVTSATVGKPMILCRAFTGTCDATIVERLPLRRSPSGSRVTLGR